MAQCCNIRDRIGVVRYAHTHTQSRYYARPRSMISFVSFRFASSLQISPRRGARAEPIATRAKGEILPAERERCYCCTTAPRRAAMHIRLRMSMTPLSVFAFRFSVFGFRRTRCMLLALCQLLLYCTYALRCKGPRDAKICWSASDSIGLQRNKNLMRMKKKASGISTSGL